MSFAVIHPGKHDASNCKCSVCFSCCCKNRQTCRHTSVCWFIYFIYTHTHIFSQSCFQSLFTEKYGQGHTLRRRLPIRVTRGRVWTAELKNRKKRAVKGWQRSVSLTCVCLAGWGMRPERLNMHLVQLQKPMKKSVKVCICVCVRVCEHASIFEVIKRQQWQSKGWQRFLHLVLQHWACGSKCMCTRTHIHKCTHTHTH